MQPREIITAIKEGKIFIYPTDTLYGLGCNALNREAVEKIRNIKGRDAKPFSIIAPSIQWIDENLKLDTKIRELIKKYLPGPYTILIPKKNLGDFSHISDNELVGVRIPKHEFSSYISKANVPFITTSVNPSGQPPAITLEGIPIEIKTQVDIIPAGEVSGKPSTIIFPDGKILERPQKPS